MGESNSASFNKVTRTASGTTLSFTHSSSRKPIGVGGQAELCRELQLLYSLGDPANQEHLTHPFLKIHVIFQHTQKQLERTKILLIQQFNSQSDDDYHKEIIAHCWIILAFF